MIVNGGKSGIAGYGNVQDQIGQSNAANPALTPVLYDHSAPSGQRFSRERMPSSDIARLYHSVATLTPNGTIMIAGSNPNLDRSNIEYGTEYRVEWLSPPYMFGPRPAFQNVPELVSYGQAFTLTVSGMGDSGQTKVQGLSILNIHCKGLILICRYLVSLMDLGFVTHGVHMNARLVILECHLSDNRDSLTVTAPPHGGVYPPGPGWLYVVVNDVPSAGKKLLVGGTQPPVDQGAIDQ